MANATHFFLGANSGEGFQNLFERFCFSEDHHDLMILKGGPGCGKSTMMRKIGAAMEELGEQVEYLHCSGDPDSLDGVNIPRIRTAVLDGTAPHVIEAKYPAAVDRYIDLGRFYDISAAKRARDEILLRTDSCSEAYKSAYSVLGAALKLEDNAFVMMRQSLDQEKLLRRTQGIIDREIRGRGSGETTRHRFLGSLTCKGPVTYFNSVETLCPRIYAILDDYGAASFVLERIHEQAAVRGYGMILCPDPEHPKQLLHLMIPELALAFVSVNEKTCFPCEAYRRIHLNGMVSEYERKKLQGKLRLSRKMIVTLRDEGIGLLQKAKQEHDALEAIYHPGVDFDGVEALTYQEIERIKKYL